MSDAMWLSMVAVGVAALTLGLSSVMFALGCEGEANSLGQVEILWALTISDGPSETTSKGPLSVEQLRGKKHG